MNVESNASSRTLLFAGWLFVAAVGGVVHHEALFQPTPQQDEPVFVEAAEIHRAGRSPYAQERYNYPPPLAALGAGLIDRGDVATFLAVVRGANLLALAALALFAARFAGLSPRGRVALAAAMVALLPISHYTIWIGNLTPIVALLALWAWTESDRRPLRSSLALAASLLLKPVALVGAIYLALRTLRQRGGRAWPTLAWAPIAAIGLLPWMHELPAMVRRMTEPPIFSTRNLSLRRVFDGFGLDLPASLLALAVLGVALWLARHREVGGDDRLHAAPVVALLALPVAWPHGFFFVLPLQVACARRWWDRREHRNALATRGASIRERNLATAERWGVPLVLLSIQGSVGAGVEGTFPPWVSSLLVLMPVAAPSLLLAYWYGTAPCEANYSDSSSTTPRTRSSTRAMAMPASAPTSARP